MFIDFFGKGVLVELRREKVNGRVSGVASVRLKQRKSLVHGAPRDFRFQESVDDRPSLGRGGYKSGGAMLDRRSQSGAAQLDREEDLTSGVVVELPADDDGEGGEGEGIKMIVDGEKLRGLTRAEAV